MDLIWLPGGLWGDDIVWCKERLTQPATEDFRPCLKQPWRSQLVVVLYCAVLCCWCCMIDTMGANKRERCVKTEVDLVSESIFVL